MSLAKKQVYPPSPRTERGKPSHISGDIKNKRDIVYCAGQIVVVRNLDDPTQCYLYTNHQHQVAVAKMSPSGYYIASADMNGQCQIWDTVGEEHICVLTRDVVDTPMDIDWSDDSKRCCVVGAGRSRMGDAFFTDTGAAVGTISGHSNPILSCSIRHTRPFRLATGSEDRKINVFPGPPYNFETSLTNHTKYVNCVRYSPNGDFLLSVGGDKLVALFDGKESTFIRSSDEGHSASVYSASWSDDSTRFLTGGADKTARIWDASSLTVLQTFTFPNNIVNFQVGTLWQGNNLITCNLRGDLTYLDETAPDHPLRVLHGHPRRIICLEYDRLNNFAYTTDGSGYSIQWREGSAETRVFEENILDNVVLSKLSNGLLYLASVDGSLGAGSVETFETVGKVTFGVLPRSFDVIGDEAIVILEDQKALFISNFEVVGEMELGYDAAVIAISPDGSKVAIGGNDNHVRVYNRSGHSLTHAYDCKKHVGRITCLAWSPDGAILASGGADRYIYGWEGSTLKINKWVFHASSVNALAWSPDGDKLASGGADKTIFIWSVSKPIKKIKHTNAHAGAVNGVAWVDDNTLLSIGDEGAMNSWIVTHTS